LKATLVDGVYDKDPNTHSDAIMFKELTFDEVLSDALRDGRYGGRALPRLQAKVVVFKYCRS